jgi:hypothetical protein
MVAMRGWLQKLLGRESDAPLTGAPPVRRQKTYSAESGYVYQYCYEGQRMATRGGEQGTQFVFSIHPARGDSFYTSIWVSANALLEWERSHGRELRGNERHAVAKMALFRAFDERESPQAMRVEVTVGPGAVAPLLAAVGIE